MDKPGSFVYYGDVYSIKRRRKSIALVYFFFYQLIRVLAHLDEYFYL